MRFFRVSLSLLLCLPILVHNVEAQKTINVPADQPTIQAGINAATRGDTVLVAPGTYSEHITFAGKAITVASSAGPASTIIDAGNAHAVVTFNSGEGSSSVITGFTIRHGGWPDLTKAPDGYRAQDYGGIYVSGGAPTIVGNIITDNACTGISSRSGAPTILSNTISLTRIPKDSSGNEINCGGIGHGTGILLAFNQLGSVPPKVMVNTIEGNGVGDHGTGGAIELWVSEGAIIRNNTIRNNTSLPFGGGGAITAYNTNTFWIVQNLFYGNIDTIGGIYLTSPATQNDGDFNSYILHNTFDNAESLPQMTLEGDLSRTVVANNIFAGSGSTSVRCSVYGTFPPSFDHNLVLSGVSGDASCTNQANAFGNLTGAPGFNNTAARDYKLASSSKAIDAGNVSASQYEASDFSTTNARRQDGTGAGVALPDLGIYERAGTAAAQSTYIEIKGNRRNLGAGQQLTLTATLTSTSSAIPTGTVDFYTNAGTKLGSSATNASGVATFTVPSMPYGLNAFYASYAGQGSFPPSISLHIYVFNNALETATALTFTPPNPYALNTITFTASVSRAPAFVVNSGTVTFTAGPLTLGTAALDSTGKAVLNASIPVAGNQAVTATYNGTFNFGSSSATVTVPVALNNSETQLSVSPLNARAYQTLTAVLNVSSTTAVSAKPPGSVSYSANGTTIGSANLDTNGRGTYSFQLPAGTATIQAAYAGNGAFAPSADAKAVTVLADDTNLALAVSPASAVRNTTILFTATISAANSSHAVPGVVSFVESGVSIGTATIDSAGRAQFSISTLAPGIHTVAAVYAGNLDFNPSTSAAVTVTIIPQDYSVSVTPDPFKLQAEHHAQMTVKLTSVGGFADVVDLGCVNLPAHASCAFKDAALLLPANGTAETTVMVDTSDVIGYKSSLDVAKGIVFAALLPMGLFAAVRRKRLAGAALLLLLVCVSGCSGKYPGYTPPGTYTIQVAAHGRASNQNRAVSVTFIVTP